MLRAHVIAAILLLAVPDAGAPAFRLPPLPPPDHALVHGCRAPALPYEGKAERLAYVRCLADFIVEQQRAIDEHTHAATMAGLILSTALIPLELER